jgi:hypothetical protein
MPDKEKGVELPEMNDEARAKAKADFKFSKDQLINIVEKYRQRKYVEDLEYIKDGLGGVESLLDGLNVHPE